MISGVLPDDLPPSRPSESVGRRLLEGDGMRLKAVLLNCTLKKSPEPSHTQALMDIVIGHLESLEVDCEVIRVVDHNIPFGVDSDLGDGDEWPQILDRILTADILI